MKKLYAGLDRDGVVKLFVIERDRPRTIVWKEWLEIVAEIGGMEPGEMPVVELSKDQEEGK